MKSWYTAAVVLPGLVMGSVGTARAEQETEASWKPRPACIESSGPAYLVRDINPGPANGFVLFPRDVEGRLFFGANDGVHGQELWKSDGTEAGTVLVKDINPGPDSSIVDPDINGIGSASFRGEYYFPAGTPDTGLELWKSDGTEAGTVLVKDIRPGPARSEFGYLTPLGHRLVFEANDGVSGFEPWVSDGTPEGTRLLKDIRPGPEGSLPLDLRRVGRKVFFTANDGVHGTELWVTNGTEAGTRLVEDLLEGPESSGPFQFHELDDTLVFLAANEGGGFDVWRSDGTRGGTYRLKELFPGAVPLLMEGWREDRKPVVYFAGNDGTTGWELWVTDGTTRGTRRAADIVPGPGSSFPNGLTTVGSTVFFSADDGATGFELWRSNGTPGGTRRVKDIWPGPSSGIDGLGATGSEGGLQRVGERFVFAADDGVSGLELWVSDGTEEGTSLLQDINPGPASSVPTRFAHSGGRIFFMADDGTHGEELWALPERVLDDETRPDLRCPDSIRVKATSRGGTWVSYPPASVNDDTGLCPRVHYSRRSGSFFPVGTIRVHVTATDLAGNSRECTFKVKVERRH
ncbi:MAG TPA: ELWxxDGT repeat protein [Archangium sp.]|uniref:ELWxxDGT repeat protein n=1 Tax=Archangium sp. TaxID=1872627 RepID=UPI002E35CC79|nr:ELWxxDGT repeat protein [Archangium sp.]HEX5747571.1 ELWxxDGT repeat protein [Archangium sp.]